MVAGFISLPTFMGLRAWRWVDAFGPHDRFQPTFSPTSLPPQQPPASLCLMSSDYIPRSPPCCSCPLPFNEDFISWFSTILFSTVFILEDSCIWHIPEFASSSLHSSFSVPGLLLHCPPYLSHSFSCSYKDLTIITKNGNSFIISD